MAGPSRLVLLKMKIFRLRYWIQALVMAALEPILHRFQSMAEPCIFAPLTRCLHFYNLQPLASLLNRTMLEPTTPAVSPLWLGSILYQNGIIDNAKLQVKSVQSEPLSENRGLSAAIFRLRVEYSTEISATHNEGAHSLPQTLILKMRSSSSLQRSINGIVSGQCREAFFLQKFGKKFKFLPKVFFASASTFSGMFLIIMEDLGPNSTGLNFYFGNQIWGMKPLEKPLDPVLVLRNVMRTAADLHGSFWRDASLLECKELKAVSWYKGQEEVLWWFGIESGRSAWKRAKQKLLSGKTNINLSQKLVSIIDASYANASWEALQVDLRHGYVPFTITHGDFHAANMMWTRRVAKACEVSEEESLIMLDFSEVGVWEPMTDIGQMMISDIKPELRRQHERDLIHLYWKHLTEHIDADYSFERCWECYERGGVEKWIEMFSLLASMDFPPSAIQYFHDQLLLFIEDHGDCLFYQLKSVIPMLPS